MRTGIEEAGTLSAHCSGGRGWQKDVTRAALFFCVACVQREHRQVERRRASEEISLSVLSGNAKQWGPSRAAREVNNWRSAFLSSPRFPFLAPAPPRRLARGPPNWHTHVGLAKPHNTHTCCSPLPTPPAPSALAWSGPHRPSRPGSLPRRLFTRSSSCQDFAMHPRTTRLPSMVAKPWWTCWRYECEDRERERRLFSHAAPQCVNAAFSTPTTPGFFFSRSLTGPRLRRPHHAHRPVRLAARRGLRP